MWRGRGIGGMKVVAFGDPIVDIVSDVPAELLTRLQAEPGGCSLVDEKELGDLLAQEEVEQSARRCAGGRVAAHPATVPGGVGDSTSAEVSNPSLLPQQDPWRLRSQRV